MEIKDIENKIINADCMDILKQLPDKCIDCILTDPPYFGIVKNDWDNQWKNIQEFQSWVGEVGKELYRVLKDNGSVYWFGDDKTIAYCQVELDKYFRLLNSLVWRKNNACTIKGTEYFRSFSPITERCLFYDKGEDKTGLEMVKSVMPNPMSEYLKNEFEKAKVTNREISKLFPSRTGGLTGCVSNWLNGDNFPTKEQYLKIKLYLGDKYLRREYEDLRRVWNSDKKSYDVLDFPICADKGRFHPTQKPLSLISYLLERSTNKDMLVLDCFSGSGTTAIACHRLKRRFICIEKDKGYYEASVKCLEDEQRQGVLF